MSVCRVIVEAWKGRPRERVKAGRSKPIEMTVLLSRRAPHCFRMSFCSDYKWSRALTPEVTQWSLLRINVTIPA